MKSNSIKILSVMLLLIFPLRSENFWQDLFNAHPQSNELRSNELPRCGFHILLEAYRLQQLQLPEKIRQYKVETLQKVYSSILSPSGHFMINYEAAAIPTYDRDQNGTPDYLEFVAKSFDRAWAVEIDTLGFNPPPDINGQPKETYEIFCKSLSGLYGATMFDLSEEISSLPGNNYPSYIEISTNFSFVQYPDITTDPIVRDSLAIAVTAAHEFNHALQLGYNIWDANPSPDVFEAKDLWFIENSAVFMEEVVANQVNDYYQYLPDFFSSTYQGITYDPFTSYRIYGEVVLDIMAARLYGRSIIRQVWQEIVNQPALPSLDKVFNRKGSNLERELQRLAEWMFFCGKNSIPDEYFPEAASYPLPEIIRADDYNSGVQRILDGDLPPFSIQYLKTVVPANRNLNIYLAPENTFEAWSGGVFFSFQLHHSYGFPAKVYSQIPFQSAQANSDTLFASVIAGNWNGGNTDSLIRYSLFLREYPGNFETGILVYPTIIKPEQKISYVTFKNIPSDARIEIFSSGGIHVSTIWPQFFNNNNSVFWNLKTSQGDFVGSGVYIYKIVSTNSSQSGKIVVIR